jgi:tetratricopeptide (TPR) repeat protein
MNGGLDIPNLRKTLNKKPKSLLFARLADELRQVSLGEDGKLEEALKIADKGLEMNPNFLQGRLVRGRILLEKGDFTGAKIDLEFVAEKDPFCLSAQKLLLETFAKLGESPQTEVYQEILSSLEPEVAIDPRVLQSFEHAKAANASGAGNKTTRANKAAGVAKTTKMETPPKKDDVFAALDNILEEDSDKEKDIKGSIFKAFDNIFEKPPEEKAPKKSKETVPLSVSLGLPPSEPELVPYTPPSSSSAPAAPLPEPAAPLPELSLPELSSDFKLEKSADEPLPKANIDDLVAEQLASKIPDSELPNLAGDLDALLSTSHDVPSLIEHTSLASPAADIPGPETHSFLEQTSLAGSTPPNIDDILSEQLAPKIDASEMPDFSGDLSSLLASASAAASTTPNIDDILSEQLAPKIDASEMPDLSSDLSSLLASAPAAAPTAPSIDDILSEQLAPKIDASEMPDLSGDLSSLLASAPAEPATAPNAPNIDDILSEQLAPKIDASEVPDFTGDLSSLLASASAESAAPKTPSIDDILSEQLAPKIDASEMPDLSGDLSSLLASAPAAPPTAPKIDDIVNEQLSSKISDSEMPNFMGDMNSLLASVPAGGIDAEPELMPYIPPAKPKSAAPKTPNVEDIISEQLAPKVSEGDIPNLTGDMESLLASDMSPEDIFAQNPTPTLAELYLNQGLAQKAVDMYKELLARDPSNADLKAKLENAKSQIES